MILAGAAPLAIVFNGATPHIPARTNTLSVQSTVIMWDLVAN